MQPASSPAPAAVESGNDNPFQFVSFEPPVGAPPPSLPSKSGPFFLLAVVIMAGAVGAALGVFGWTLLERVAPPPGSDAPRTAIPAARNDLSTVEQQTIQIFHDTAPSVVHITTTEQRRDLFTRRVTEVPQGTGSGFTMELQDLVGNSPEYLAEQAQRFIAAAMERPEIGRISTVYRASVPQVFADIDRRSSLSMNRPG